jgi:hypothetical protein
MVRVKPDVAVAGLRGQHASPAAAAPELSSIGNTRDASPGMTLARFRGVSGDRVSCSSRSTGCVAEINHECQSARVGGQPRDRPSRSCQGTRCAQARSMPEGRAERAVEANASAHLNGALVTRRALTAPSTALGWNDVMAGQSAGVQHAHQFVSRARARTRRGRGARSMLGLGR